MPTPSAHRRSISRLTLAAAAALALALPAGAYAIPPKLSPTGQSAFVFGSEVKLAGNGATSMKPESKLFYTPDGRWWGVLGTSGANAPSKGVWIYELVNHRWQARVKLPGADPWEKTDTFLAPDNTLYVATRDNRAPTATNPRNSKTYKISYLGNGNWGTPSDPVLLTDQKPESVTIARDSAGRLWAAWEEGSRVKVKATSPGLMNWFSVDIVSGQLSPDDYAAVVHFGTQATGFKIGVLWSDQLTQTFRFAWKPDGTKATGEFWRYETAYGGGVGGCPTPNGNQCANNHINLKANGDDVYAAVKTHLDFGSTPSPSDPLTLVMRRSGAGTWSHYPVATVAQRPSRPIVVLSPARDLMWVFSQKDMNDVYVWESRMSAPRFFSGAWSPWTTGAGSRNDPTSTKQTIPAGMPTVVETSFDWGSPTTNDYWHNAFLP